MTIEEQHDEFERFMRKNLGRRIDLDRAPHQNWYLDDLAESYWLVWRGAQDAMRKT